MKINYYLRRLIKENIIYLISLLFILSIYFIFFINSINRINQIETKIKITKGEIESLKIKTQLINYKEEIKKENIDINKVNQLLFQLIPDNEDYFSVIFALEKLSEQTGFIIFNYSVDINQLTKDRLNLVVEGFGSKESFFNFLNSYRYQGGRLLTIDKIEYEGKESIKAKLNIYLYNAKVPLLEFSSKYQLNKNQKDIIKKIQDETPLLNAIENTTNDYSYPTKTDPF